MQILQSREIVQDIDDGQLDTFDRYESQLDKIAKGASISEFAR